VYAAQAASRALYKKIVRDNILHAVNMNILPSLSLIPPRTSYTPMTYDAI